MRYLLMIDEIHLQCKTFDEIPSYDYSMIMKERTESEIL